MAVRPFVLYPDARLSTPALPVEDVDEAVRMLWADMLDTMYAMPGVGLAAPQIGVGLRVAVVDCSAGANDPVRLANPEILHASEVMRDHEEASPNIPGLSAKVSRPRAVTVRFLNAAGEIEERDFVGLWATSVQHQIDHLEGKLFVDRLGPVKRKMLLSKHLKRMKRAG
ncbi:MAG: peptide deformylase [Pseudomonadota bacterium]